MGSAVGVFSAVPPYMASLSSLLVPLSAPAEQSQGRPVLGQTCKQAASQMNPAQMAAACYYGSLLRVQTCAWMQCRCASTCAYEAGVQVAGGAWNAHWHCTGRM